MTDKKLSGKVALVTGGSRGIGAAMVRRLARDGAQVVFTYVAAATKADALAAEVAADGGTAVAFAADSADPAAVQAAVAHTMRRFGRLDILVNNAGILIRGGIDEFAMADFDRMLAVNVRAVFAAIQTAVAHMARGARIITIGSVVADRSGFAGSSVYSMTKAAVAGLTRGLARDLGPRGITVNVVQPGPIETDINDDAAMRDMIRPLIAIGQLGKGAEVASLVAYLAGPESGFITGAALTVDGGYLA
ncbi:3-oxoacyl-ACP reductase family protein [Sphingomonas sp.]|uniref:3-oxoacyl-ACP reductase family protein n=1 Tax=Sphingomonas sp. TaxID=28214 RepID=UPI003D6C782A